MASLKALALARVLLFIRCDLALVVRMGAFTSLIAILLIIGCVAFVFSTISPFYQVIVAYSHAGIIFGNYWSFKYDTYRGWMNKIYTSPESVLLDYWFGQNSPLGQNVALTLIATFMLQVFTISLGLTSVFFRKRMLLVTPVCSSLIVLGLMAYTGKEIANYGTYQAGFWLVFPSCGLFLIAFLLNEVYKNRKQAGAG